MLNKFWGHGIRFLPSQMCTSDVSVTDLRANDDIELLWT